MHTQRIKLRKSSNEATEFLALTEGLTNRTTNLPLNLLVVDVDEHIREVCRSVASDTGMNVLDVSTAEEALEWLELSSVADAGDLWIGVAEESDRGASGHSRGDADAVRNE
jgi:hypothetical protein